MTEKELRELLSEHRWTLRDSMRLGEQIVYTAAQRQGSRTVSKYIATERRLAEMARDDVLAILRRPPKRGQ